MTAFSECSHSTMVVEVVGGGGLSATLMLGWVVGLIVEGHNEPFPFGIHSEMLNKVLSHLCGPDPSLQKLLRLV